MNNKYWIIDYSFYIYNGSFAFKTPCKCVSKTTFKPKSDCTSCEGSGKIFMHNSSGFRTGGLFAVLRMAIEKITEGWDVIVVFDPPKDQLHRTKMLDSYKGNRSETPEWIQAQMEFGERLLLPFTKIKCYTSENDESDDVMATIAIEKANEGHTVVVASDDKDMFPLLDNKNITLFRQKALFTKRDFIEKFNFEPKRFNEYLAICGDAADNFNLLEGLGPKAAEEIIKSTKNSSLEIFDNMSLVSRKVSKKLINCSRSIDDKCLDNKTCCTKCANFKNNKRSTMELSLKIATLVTDAKYFNVNKKRDKKQLMDALDFLGMRWVTENIDKLL